MDGTGDVFHRISFSFLEFGDLIIEQEEEILALLISRSKRKGEGIIFAVRNCFIPLEQEMLRGEVFIDFYRAFSNPLCRNNEIPFDVFDVK